MKHFFFLLFFLFLAVAPIYACDNVGERCDGTEYGGPNRCCDGGVCNDYTSFNCAADHTCTDRFTTRANVPHPEFTLPGCGAPTPALSCDATGDEYNQCCAAGKSQHVVRKHWSSGGGVCSYEVGDCNQNDGACGGGTPPTIPPTQPPGIPPPTTVPATPTPVQPTIVVTFGPTPTRATNRSISSNAPQMGQRWACLKTDPCSNATSGCSGAVVRDAGHRVKLSAKPDSRPLVGETYIVECLETPQGPRCTTGNADTDLRLLGVNNAAAYQSQFAYRLLGFFNQDGRTRAANPLQTPTSRDIGIHEWESETHDSLGRVFMAVNLTDATSTVGGSGGQQQATFNFDSSNKNCVMIRWDPEGTVFDNYTLEPLSQAQITLLKKAVGGKRQAVKNSDVVGEFSNPVITKQDGNYHFFVPNGTYSLQVKASDYRFPVEKLNSAASNFYSSFYQGGEFTQKDTMLHLDIPLQPDNNQQSVKKAEDTPVEVISLNQYLVKEKHVAVVEGILSHPQTRVTLYAKRPTTNNESEYHPTRVLATTTADKNRYFKFEVSIDGFMTTESLGLLEFNKPSVMKQARVQPRYLFHAPLAYIEGYARDERGFRLANATVNLRVESSVNPVVSTTTNSSGYFSLSPSHIPNIPFTLQYVSTNKETTTLSMAKFAEQNNQHFLALNINLNTGAHGDVAGARTKRSFLQMLFRDVSFLFK